jgi:hypothetical protein
MRWLSNVDPASVVSGSNERLRVERSKQRAFSDTKRRGHRETANAKG